MAEHESPSDQGRKARSVRFLSAPDALMVATDDPIRAEHALCKVNLVLHPGTDDVIGDRYLRWSRQAVWMAPQQHRGNLLAIEPAGIIELRAIDDDLVRARLGMAADH